VAAAAATVKEVAPAATVEVINLAEGVTNVVAVLGQRHRLAERGDAGAGQQPVGCDTGGNHRLQQSSAFVVGKGVRLARGAEHRDPVAALGQQAPAMGDEQCGVRRALCGHRGQRSGVNAARMLFRHAPYPNAQSGATRTYFIAWRQ